jgi:hypothetical protein
MWQVEPTSEPVELAMGDLSVWQELALVGAAILIFTSICLLEGSSK